MITVELGRRKDGETSVNTRKMNSHDALALLIECELAWGAEIIEAGQNLLVVETSIMHMVDTTKFSGDHEEMKPLLELAYYYNLGAANQTRVDKIVDAVTDEFMQLPDRNRTPLIAQMVGPLLIGRTRLKTAALLALGISPENIKSYIEHTLDDIVAAIQLQAEGTCSFDEAINSKGGEK